MRKALWSVAALIALLSGATVTWAPRAKAAGTAVEIGRDNKFKYEPAEISVPVNTTVDWTNKSAIQHDVKADSGLFKSELLNKDQTYSFTFTTPGDFRYICTVSGHEDAGMVGVVKVTGGATPTTAASTTTTAGGTTATTAAASSTTSTTTAKAAAGGSTTTTTAGGGVTSTTQAPSVTPTSAPETGEVTTTTTAVGGGGEEAAAGGGHGSEKPKSEGSDKSSPIGIAFVAVSTLLLTGISGKLLASKS